MKHFLPSLFLVFSFFCGNAQILEPVKWDTKVDKISNTEFNLIFEAKIDDGWYMYSQEEPDGIGPLPTYFEYKNQDGNYELIGKTSEPKTKPKFDKVFEIDVKKFTKKAIFSQRISIVNKDFSSFEVYLSYQACDNGRCVMLENLFEVSLDDSGNGSVVEKKKD